MHDPSCRTKPSCLSSLQARSSMSVPWLAKGPHQPDPSLASHAKMKLLWSELGSLRITHERPLHIWISLQPCQLLCDEAPQLWRCSYGSPTNNPWLTWWVPWTSSSYTTNLQPDTCAVCIACLCSLSFLCKLCRIDFILSAELCRPWESDVLASTHLDLTPASVDLSPLAYITEVNRIHRCQWIDDIDRCDHNHDLQFGWNIPCAICTSYFLI